MATHIRALIVVTAALEAALVAPLAAQDPLLQARTAAQQMKSRGATAPVIAREARNTWRLGAPATTDVLRSSGFTVDEATGALLTEYRLSGFDIYAALRSAGYGGRPVADALTRYRVPLDLSCIDPEGFPAPCGAFSDGTAAPMGQLTWSPVDQGPVNGTLTITGSNIPAVEVMIGSTILNVAAASPTTVVAILPSTPQTGRLRLRRVSDGRWGELAASYTVVAPAVNLDWAALVLAARNAAVAEARAWLANAHILAAGCTVNAMTAVGVAGVFGSTHPFTPAVATALQQAGAPADLAAAWDGAFRDAWIAWASQVIIPPLPWYPSFAAVAAPQALPLPNVATPLAALVSPGSVGLLPPLFEQRLRAAIGASADPPQAQSALEAFAAEIGQRFTAYVALAQVVNVMGTGPVPSFTSQSPAPGPVTGGSCAGTNVLTHADVF